MLTKTDPRPPSWVLKKELHVGELWPTLLLQNSYADNQSSTLSAMIERLGVWVPHYTSMAELEAYWAGEAGRVDLILKRALGTR